MAKAAEADGAMGQGMGTRAASAFGTGNRARAALLNRGHSLALLSKASPRIHLMMAVYKGHIEVVRMLLDHGADVNTKAGQSLLMVAALSGRCKMVRLLLERGADLEETSNHGQNAVLSCRSEECLALLHNAERIQRWHRRGPLAVWRR